LSIWNSSGCRLTCGALALALLVSILAALYPAALAAHVDPVTAPRHD
jgi:ABC-type lipoprotein release transport system permease subunit